MFENFVSNLINRCVMQGVIKVDARQEQLHEKFVKC